MEKKTLFAFVTVLVLGVGAFITLRTPEKGQRVGPPPRPVPAMKAADVARLELTSEKQGKVTLERVGDKWRVKAPSDWAADQQAAKTLTEALEKLSFASQVTEGVEKHEELGVKEGKAARVIAYGAGGRLCDLFVGKSVSGYTMIRPADKNEVWQASGLFPYQLNKEPKDWRDHALFSFSDAEVSRLSVAAGASKLVVERDKPKDGSKNGNATDGKWKVAEATGSAPKDVTQLDVNQVQGAVSSFATLRASDFADDKKPEEVGLDKPVLTLTLTTQNGPHSLLIGQTQGDDTYVKTDTAPTVYLLKRYSIERLAHPPRDYGDKTLLKATESELGRLEVVQGTDSTILEHAGDKWKLKGAVVDEAKLKPFIATFSNLQGSGFSDNKDPQKTGLGKPKATISIDLKEKSKVMLKVGALDREDYFVQKTGSAAIFLVKKYQIDRILKKPSELSATPTAKK